jgi:RNA polymerase sigma-70 factor (ECF subfamily)
MSAEAAVWPGDESKVADTVERARTLERDEAFAGMVARQSRLMFRVAYGLLRNANDAEDAVQEAFLKLYRGEAWRAMEDEKAFLARTVWRVALDRVPARMDDVAGMELASAARSPESYMVEADERELLRLLIDALPEELRQALVLSAIGEMTSREVGVVMGIPEGTVRTRVMRAKLELKKRFEAMEGARR